MPLDMKPHGKYIHERVRSVKLFKKGSLRTVPVGKHRVIVGRLKRSMTTTAQSILHPKSESKTRFKGRFQ